MHKYRRSSPSLSAGEGEDYVGAEEPEEFVGGAKEGLDLRAKVPDGVGADDLVEKNDSDYYGRGAGEQCRERQGAAAKA